MKIITKILGIKSNDNCLFDCDEIVLLNKSEDIKDFFKDNNVAAEASILLIIGPEGGFSEAEANKLKDELEARIITLGPRVLRTETAGITALTAILYEKGELGD